MKILNLYAGEGGNREFWGDNHEITAVELNSKVADKYRSLFPRDNVIVEDAHEYLLDHYREFDFIWSSPPCQTHSRANYFINSIAKRSRYPNMSLYQEIIFLQQFCKSYWVVENVISYYQPLIQPFKIGRHFIWSNFKIVPIQMPKNEIGSMDRGWNTACRTPIGERNKANSELGKHILDTVLGIANQPKYVEQSLFS